MTLPTTPIGSSSGSRRRAGAFLVAALATVVALGSATAARAQLPSDWLSYAAVAKSRLDIGSNIEVSGNYAVIQQGGRLSLGTNLYHSSTGDGFLAADQMEFTTGASANDVYVNALQLNGTAEVRGSITTPFTFPLDVDVPSLPADATSNPCTASAQNVTISTAQSGATLPAGCYRDLTVNHDAVLELTGGNYVFRRIRIEPGAQVVALATSVLNVQDNLTMQLRSALFAQSVEPADLTLYVAGQNTQLGNESLFVGRIVAPNDPRLEFGVRAIFLGNAYAEGINIFGVHTPRTATPVPTGTPFVPPTPTPTPTPTATPAPPTPTPPGTPTPTPTPTPPGVTPTPTPTSTAPPPPTPTEPFNPPCPPAFTSPHVCDQPSPYQP